MPGLNQLKQFNSDLLNLGDEVKIRSARGEKPSVVPIPKDVYDRDDSSDFKNGMPEVSEEEQQQAEAAARELERQKNDFSDITGEGEEEAEELSPMEVPASPDVSSLLNTSLDLDDLDLSDFAEPVAPEPEPEPEEIPIEDLDLDSLLAVPQKEEPVEEPEVSDIPEISDIEELPSQGPKKIPSATFEDVTDSLFDDSIEVMEAVDETPVSSAPMEDLETLGSFDDTGLNSTSDDFAAADMASSELLGDLNLSDSLDMGPADDFGIDTAVSENTDSSLDMDDLNSDFNSAGSALDMNEGLPPELTEIPGVMQMKEEDTADTGSSDFDLPDMNFDEGSGEADSIIEEPADTSTDSLAGSSDDFSSDTGFDLPDMNFDAEGSSDLPDMGDIDGISGDADSFEAPSDNTSVPEENGDAGEDTGFSASDFDTGDMDGANIDFGTSGETEGGSDSDSSSGFDFDTGDLDGANIDFGTTGDAESGSDSDSSSGFDFDTGDLDGANIDFGTSEETESGSESDSSSGFDFDTGDMDGGNISFDAPSSEGGIEGDSSEFDMSGLGDMNLDNFSFDGIGGETVTPDMSVPDAEEKFETFDTSAMNGLDFSSEPDTSYDFEMGNVTTQEQDEDNLFSIPGFSDTVTADLNKGPAKPIVETPDFSNAIEGDDKPANTFTDAEYKRFQKNLSEYPLNVRIAIEDLVVKNEFTDDAVFEILDKVLRKVPARQIATDLEKMLDVTLDVPRDFERRTVAEYEAYKKSLEYQLKNRILPGAILTAAAAIMMFCIYVLSVHFIYNPIRANSLYKQGYVLLEEEQYTQSLDCFNEARNYRDVKSWYYTYAQGFRDHRQYEKARSMYKAILAFYDHEKTAGMLWADMEKNDLYNYEETERVLKREVLDYHINDNDAILSLGDLYLDWATEKDPSKFQEAKEYYDYLAQNGKADQINVYLSRQMRYYIRTDNLRQVLGYKEYFYSLKGKKGLGAEDLTELSGFLLDKLYGTLSPSEESLRFNIENVRELLERAVTADPSNPVALYNMGRYFVETDQTRSAKNLFENAILQFNQQKRRSRSETYKFINCYRLLGEEYTTEKEYILAEEMYGEGIAAFEKEQNDSGFESDANVGRLYADMGDLDYFISGDMDRALTNYENSILNKNDIPSIRYKIGYIQYKNNNFAQALGSFIRSAEAAGDDTHLLLALANTLSIRNDNYAAQGYYERLVNILNGQRELYDVVLPQVREDQGDLVDVYMKATNNLGVTLSRIAQSTGNSSLNGKAIVNMQESLRAWDALTRNQTTMLRLEGSNLAEMNIKYLTNPGMGYEPEIYTEIFKLMNGEDGLN